MKILGDVTFQVGRIENGESDKRPVLVSVLANGNEFHILIDAGEWSRALASHQPIKAEAVQP